MRSFKIALIVSLSFFIHLIKSQGVLNNGAQLNFSGAVAVNISGNNIGSYTSQNNGIINPSAAGQINLQGNWINNSSNTGFSSDNGTVSLNGANQTIGGTNSTTFYNLTLAGSGIKTQNMNTSVGGGTTTTGILNLNNLIYQLNGTTLTITNTNPSAILYSSGNIESETNSSINSSVLRRYLSSSPNTYIYPFGVGGVQIPLTLNKTSTGSNTVDVSTRSTLASDNLPWAGNSNVSAVTFFYCPNNALSGNPCASNSVIDRWWDITPVSPLTADVTFSYRGIENTLNAPYNSGLIGAQWWDGSAWNQDNATTGSAIATTSGIGNVTALNLNQFCPFILSSVSVPLPIESLDLTSNCQQNDVVLNWKTENEKNTKLFIIEKSENASDYVQIGQVNASETTYGKRSYTFIDENANSTTVNYYRLKEVDTYGSIKKHNAISNHACVPDQTTISINNTADGKASISFNASTADTYTIKLYDMVNKCVFSEMKEVQAGYQQFELNASSLPPSVYLLSIVGQTTEKHQKVKLN